MLRLRLDPIYVLDVMTMGELDIYIEYAYMAKQDEWEQARLEAYITAQCNSTKKLKPSDIMTFAWEKKMSVESEQPTQEQINNIRNRAEKIKAWLQ